MNIVRFLLASFALVTLSCSLVLLFLLTVNLESWSVFDWIGAGCAGLLLYPAGVLLCIAAEMLSQAKGWLGKPARARRRLFSRGSRLRQVEKGTPAQR
jgi:hypothetical protein